MSEAKLRKTDILYNALVNDPGHRAYHYTEIIKEYKHTRSIQSGLTGLIHKALATQHNGGYYPLSPKHCSKCKSELYHVGEDDKLVYLECEAACIRYAHIKVV